MNRRVAAVLVCTFLALVAATVWVPCTSDLLRTYRAFDVPGESSRLTLGHLAWDVSPWPSVHFRPLWSLDEFQLTAFGAQRFLDRPRRWPASIHLPTLAIELGLILLIGGGLLTWVVRRERRKRAPA